MPKNVHKNIKHEFYHIIKRNGYLVEQIIKTRLINYCLDITMETILINTTNSKTSEPHKFLFSLPQRLELKNSDKYVVLRNLSIY